MAFLEESLAQESPNRYPDPFVDLSLEAGIAHLHQGEWDQFAPDFSSGYLGIGQAWGDYDKDGWLDLFVTGNLNPNALYRNRGDGTFELSPLSAGLSQPGVPSGGASWADYDNDGWLDLYVVNFGPNTLYHNEQGRAFVDVTAIAGIGDSRKGSGATWGDYNQDGFLDLYIANWSCYPECGDIREHDLARDTLYRSNGDGTFSDVSHLLTYKQLLGAGFSASFVDYDSDGDMDLYVVNDKYRNPIGNVLWRNEGPDCGEWCWTDASAETGAGIVMYGMGLAVGDYDQDSDLDFYVTNYLDAMLLLQNQGDGRFENATRLSGAGIKPGTRVGWGTAFFDYDNDGWLDLFVTNTEFIQTPYRGPQGLLRPPEDLLGPYPNVLLRNNGDGTFSDTTPPRWGWDRHPSMGLAYADYDNDGWVDVILGEWNESYRLFRNRSADFADNHWLTLRLKGGGPVNQDAVGSRVYLSTDDGRIRRQDVINSSNMGGGSDLALHFGLGQSSIQRLRIVWPDATQSELYDISPNQILQVTYPHSVETLFAEGIDR